MEQAISSGGAPSDQDAPSPGTAGLIAFHRRRKQDSRERLLQAALARFQERGYLAVSVDDIATAAGVSRMTFYRHFSGKADIAADLFGANIETARPRLLRIGAIDFRDRDVVAGWLSELFEADRRDRGLLRVFTQATAEESFVHRAHDLIGELIAGLGTTIPAFDVDRAHPDQERRWLEAWLLLYEILDQSGHAALDLGVAGAPMLIDILADRFLDFVTR